MNPGSSPHDAAAAGAGRGGREMAARSAAWRGYEPRDIAPLASLALIFVFFSLTAKGFLSADTLGQVLSQGSFLALAATGMTFVMLAAEIDLSVGMVALWAACFCGSMFKAWRGEPPVDEQPGPGVLAMLVLAPLASCVAAGIVSGLLTVWSRLPSFIITLAMMNVALGASQYQTGSESLPMPDLLKSLGNGGFDLSPALSIPYSAAAAAVVMLAGHLVLAHTRFGRYVFMTGGNREAARLAGVRTGAVIVCCLAISAGTAALAGMLSAGRLYSANVNQNEELLLSAVACVVLGGTSLFGGEGGMGKTLIGVLTFTTLNVGLNKSVWVDPLARKLLLGAVLLAALVINGVLARKGE